jgi:hypothetical protein
MLDRRILLAPFTNTTNLLTILIVTSIFAAFRIAGGGLFGTTSNNEDQAITSNTTTSSSKDFNNELTSTVKKIPSPLNDVLTDIDKSDSENSENGNAKKDPRAEKPSKKQGGLDEIERAIGLR